MVEATFRSAKSIMETRPIYHKRDETIRGHVFCSFLALPLKCDSRGPSRRRDWEAEWAQILRGLDNLQPVEVRLQDHPLSFAQRTQRPRFTSPARRPGGAPACRRSDQLKRPQTPEPNVVPTLPRRVVSR